MPVEHIVLNVKVLAGAFNQEKAFSVILKTDCESDGSSAALVSSHREELLGGAQSKEERES